MLIIHIIGYFLLNTAFSEYIDRSSSHPFYP